jgi:hypothetical protein
MLTQSQIDLIRNTRPQTVQDYIILDLLNTIDKMQERIDELEMDIDAMRD